MEYIQMLMTRVLKEDSEEWVEYEGNSWIKKEWIEEHKPYEKMAVDVEYAYLSHCKLKGLNPKTELLKYLK